MTRTAALLTAALLSATLLSAAGPTTVPAADTPTADKKPKAAPAADAPKSDQKPSTDAAAPARLEVGRYVAARLGHSPSSGRYHYWVVELPAGDYAVVMDSHRSDGGEGHVSVDAQFYDPAAGGPVGEYLAMTNSPYGRDRAVRALKVGTAGRKVIRVRNDSGMAQYQFLVVKKGDKFGTPWLARRSEVRALGLGAEVTTPRLAGGDLFDSDAYYTLDLPEGDYRVTVTYQAVKDRVPNAGVKATFLGLDGTDTPFVVSEYGSAAAGRASAKLVTAGDSKVLVRVRGVSADVTATLKVEKIDQ